MGSLPATPPASPRTNAGRGCDLKRGSVHSKACKAAGGCRSPRRWRDERRVGIAARVWSAPALWRFQTRPSPQIAPAGRPGLAAQPVSCIFAGNSFRGRTGGRGRAGNTIHENSNCPPRLCLDSRAPSPRSRRHKRRRTGVPAHRQRALSAELGVADQLPMSGLVSGREVWDLGALVGERLCWRAEDD